MKPLGVIVVAMGGDHLVQVAHPHAKVGQVAHQLRYGTLASAIDQRWVLTREQVHVPTIDVRIF